MTMHVRNDISRILTILLAGGSAIAGCTPAKSEPIRPQALNKARMLFSTPASAWYVGGAKTVHGRPAVHGWTELSEIDAAGHLNRQLHTDGTTLPQGLILWSTADDAHVWLTVIDYRGVRPNDAPVIGERKIVRLNPSTAEYLATDVDVLLRTAYCELPEHILWTSPTRQRTSQIHLLDKQTMTVSTGPELAVQYVKKLATAGNYLWVLSGQARAFSLKDFAAVSRETAGTPPPGFGR